MTSAWQRAYCGPQGSSRKKKNRNNTIVGPGTETYEFETTTKCGAPDLNGPGQVRGSSHTRSGDSDILQFL